MKTRVQLSDLDDFLTFPQPSTDKLSDPFRLKVRAFLSKHGYLPSPPSICSSLLVWQIYFRIGESNRDSEENKEIVTLDAVEEDVQCSRSVYCDQCRVIGWSGHPVCTKRYHFIIRSNILSSVGHQKLCTNCGDQLLVSNFRCKSCNCELSASDLKDWARLQLEDTTHLLHGVLHVNGYGHLLRVNGREGGSRFLSGRDIMSFWDRMCAALGARKVSVMDVSKKYGLEYRLLHAVTNGHTWYGNWGFEFGAGSFALTLSAYRRAVDCLSTLPLSLFFQAREPRTRLQDVITFYQAHSESPLRTMRELFCFLLELISKSKPSNDSKDSVSCSSVLCSWTRDDIELVQQSMIKVLQVAGGSGWVSWRGLKGSAFRLASSELLDYCLKVLEGKVLDDARMVLSRCNPETDNIEYRLVPRSDRSALLAIESNFPSRSHILRDLEFLYCALLNPQTMPNHYRSKAVQEQAISSAVKLLDCKQFVKEYHSERVVTTKPNALAFSCRVELMDQPLDYTAPPPELIFLPPNATMRDLKMEAAKAFQDVYLLFRWFQVEEMLGYGEMGESSQVKMLIGSGCSITVLGKLSFVEEVQQFRMERGVEKWTVSCRCGAKDDDGERMLACDGCGLWQHTRCVGVNDLDPVPETFSCLGCKSLKQPLRHIGTDIGLASGRRGKYGKKSALDPSYSMIGLGKSKPGKSKDKNPALYRTGKGPFRAGLKRKESSALATESPTVSGSSSITNSMEEYSEALAIETASGSYFGTLSRCTSASQDGDVYISKLDSPNPSSGTTSEETTTVLDTCSSDFGYSKRAKISCKNDQDACQSKSGLKIRFTVR